MDITYLISLKGVSMAIFFLCVAALIQLLNIAGGRYSIPEDE